MVQLRLPSAHKAFVEQAEGLLAGLPETTELVLIDPKLDKRSSFYKYLKKATDYREFAELDQAGLARWLTQQATAQQGSLSQSDALYLIGRVGASQQLLASELEKLLLFSPHVTRQSIDALTEATPQSTIFELIEAAFSGNAQRALALYDEQRALKVEPQQIIAMMAWQLHILALVKTAGDRSPDAIASAAKVSPYVVKKSVAIARRMSLSQLTQLIARLGSIDGRSKRQALNVDDALRHFVLTMPQ